MHFTSELSEKKMTVLDLQGSKFDLYDPEIATCELQDNSNSEYYFCAGNMSTVGIKNFCDFHICNKYYPPIPLDLDEEARKILYPHYGLYLK